MWITSKGKHNSPCVIFALGTFLCLFFNLYVIIIISFVHTRDQKLQRHIRRIMEEVTERKRDLIYLDEYREDVSLLHDLDVVLYS